MEEYIDAPVVLDPVSGKQQARFRGTLPNGGTFGYSADWDLSEEKQKETIAMIERVLKYTEAYNMLPEVDRLKFEIKRLTYDMRKIMDMCHTRFDSKFPETEMEKYLDKLRGDIFCESESSLMLTPSEWVSNRNESEPHWEDLARDLTEV